MGLVSKLREGLYKIRIVPKPDITDKTNISKVLDENGEPRILWHGTNYSFNDF